MEATDINYFGVSENILLILYLVAILLVVITWYVLRVERRFRYIADKDEKVATMLAVLSTQLRSPITSINWYAELVLDEDFGKLKVAQIEAIDKIKRGANQASAVVDRILELSRLDRGAVQPQMASIELGGMIERIADDCQAAAEGKQITLTYDKPITATAAYIDPLILHNIIESVIQNAINYTHENGHVNVSIQSDIDAVTVKIADNGIGIPPEEQRKVFRKFFRGQPAKLMLAAGNGLSLYMAQALLHDMQGSIWFEANPGGGTIFNIKVPQSSKAK